MSRRPGVRFASPVTRRQIFAVRTIAEYELRVRHKTAGWRWLLLLWFVLVSGVGAAVGVTVRDQDNAGAVTFGWLVLIVLLLLLLIVPAVARPPDGRFARGARTDLGEAGFAHADRALGELAAAWVVVGVLLALAAPALIATIALGGVGPARVAAALGILAGVLASVAALAQWRPGWTYVILAALCLGTPFAYDAAVPLTRYTIKQTTDQVQTRPDRVWWLLAPNPFVVVADAAAPDTDDDQLTWISDDVRGSRSSDGPVWPRGLAFLVVLGVGAAGITAGRLRQAHDKAIVR